MLHVTPSLNSWF